MDHASPPGLPFPPSHIPPRPDLGPPDVAPPRPGVLRRRWVGPIAALLALFLAFGGSMAVFLASAGPPGDPSDYTFLEANGSKGPTRWNPCEPIHYVVNGQEAPAGSLDDLNDAIHEISSVTGIEFRSEGTSSDLPTTDRDLVQMRSGVATWAPVLIAWVRPEETDVFGGATNSALGATQAIAPPGTGVYVTGIIAINVGLPQIPGFSDPGEEGPTLLHELAHLVGLGHVRAPFELMNRDGGGVVDYGAGDLAGLHHLGRSAGCVATPNAADFD